MKRLCMFLVAILFSMQVFAANFNRMVFFGDSLTDNGNLYSIALHVIPKSPPYYKGRFSNGPTWAEHVGSHFYDSRFIDYKIYAVGGATAQFRLPTDKFFPPTNLNLQIDNYLLDAAFRDKSKALYSIWIGGNDYLYYGNSDDADVLTESVVRSITNGVKKLIGNGAKYFLILNLPDPSKTPHAKANGTAARVQFLTKKHNKKLSESMDTLRALYPQVKIVYVDTFSTFNDVVTDPTKYNEKYGSNITNITDACWQGKYYYRHAVSERDLKKELIQAARATNKRLKDVEVDQIANMILESPALRATYRISKGIEDGVLAPCSNPNEYLFWDTIHPSAVVHKILAQIVIENLAANSLMPA